MQALENVDRAYAHRQNGDRARAVAECRAALTVVRGARFDVCERIAMGTAVARLTRFADMGAVAAELETAIAA